jgi:NifU-like protein involved in Fe-S cluster formation
VKENSREEDIKIIENILHKGYTMSILHPSTNIKESEIKALEHILSDYKRVLKENEELKEEKINNYRMIALAQNEALGYMQGYEDGKKHKMTAMTQVVENQQYYIIQKQMEKYEKHIKKLQKENEELNLKYYMLYTGKIENLKAQEVKIKSQVIPVQEVKDKIEEYKNMLKTCNKAKERR